MYAKLFTSIYQGTLRGNSHGLLVFTNLLAHCDKEGIADIHPRAIAEEVGLTVEQVRAALDVLESPDDESRSPEEQGRRIVRIDEHRAWGWLVVNYVKYRAIRSEEDRREQNRASQARWRERQRKRSKPASAELSRNQPQSAHTEADTEAEALIPPTPLAGGAFAEFWKAWPAHKRKVARRQCAAKWGALGCDALAPRIMSALVAAKASPDWAKDNGEFIPAPLVWLNQSRWEAPTAAEALETDPWATRAGVEAQAARVGLEKWHQMEAFDVYRRRVQDAVTGALKRVA